MGFLASGRMALMEAVEFWIAQFLGGIAGALVLWGIFSASPVYSRHVQGLGADGFGKLSMIRINAVGAFFTEVILTLLFVYVVLAATSKLMASPALAGLAIGLALTVVHLLGIPITGTSVNPARSLGPALIVGGLALSQVWLFIVAPLVGGAIAALLYRYFAAAEDERRDAARLASSRPVISARGSVGGDDLGLPRRPLRRVVQHHPALAGRSRPSCRWRAGAAGLRAATAAQVPRLLRTAPAPPGPAGRPGRRRTGPGRGRLVPDRTPPGPPTGAARSCPGPACPAGCGWRSRPWGRPTSSWARSSPPAKGSSRRNWSASSACCATGCRPNRSRRCGPWWRRIWAAPSRTSSAVSTGPRWPRRRSPRSMPPPSVPARRWW